MTKIIFIPGFMGGKRDTFIAKKILKDYDLIYFKYNTYLIQTIEEIAMELKTFINSLKSKKNEKLILIGFSAGGIISLYYAKFLDKNKLIDKIITIHSPIKGTYFTEMFSKRFKGLKQLKLNSKILNKIEKNKTKINQINFWNYFDTALPGKSGKGKNPKNSFMPLHFLVQWWPPIYYAIKRDLKNN